MVCQKQLVYKARFFIKSLIFLVFLTNLILSPQSVAAAPTTWYVTTDGNDTNSCTTAASPCLTINGAIGKAVSGDTIYVATGTYTGSGAEVVLIDKNLILLGGWDATFTTQSGTSIIDGQEARRGITVTIDTVVILDSFTVQNGFHASQGGGIRNNGTLTINNSVIQNNVSRWMGGGIFTFGTLTVNDTILSGNSAGATGNSGGGGGGAIQNYSGTTTLNNSTVSGNTLLGFFNGSGISNNTTLILNNTTVSNNTHSPSINFPASIYTFVGNVTINNSTISGNSGSGIYNNVGTLSINNSTISNNQRGIDNDNLGTLTLANSIVANNTPYYDCTGPITSNGYNLIGNNSGCTFSATTGDLVGTNIAPIDPGLGPLQDNGGPTFTHALLWGSPAIDAGNPAPPSNAGDACLSTDQRGVTRPIDDNVVVGAVCDIGAYEFNDNTPQVVILPRMYSVNEQVTLVLHGTGISVGDINDDPLTVTVAATDANSQIFADAGSTNLVISSGNGTNSLVLTGTVAQLNDFFAGNNGSTLTYRLNDDTPVVSATLTITADDGSSTGSDTAIINITAINDAPVNTVPGAQTVNEDTTLIFSAGNGNQISVNDVDVGTDSLEITLSVTNGTLTLAGTTGLDFTTGDGTADSTMVFTGTLTDINNALATLTFNPTANYYGSAILALTTSDFGNTGMGGALTDTDTVIITVNNVNDAPFVANPIPDQNATEDSAFNFQFAANTFSDLDTSDNLSYSAQLAGGGALPAWLSFNAATHTFSGTPTNSDVGTVSIDVIANDGNGGTITDTFNIVVANTNDAPVVANPIPDQNATEDAAFNFQFTANTFSDPDVGDTLTYSAQLAGGGALPAWLSFDAVTRTFSGTPSNGDVGPVSIDVIADDGNGGTVTDTFNITVAAVARFSLGNRVWFDTDNNSAINGAELGIDGVTVNLYAASDLNTILATDITSNGGYYLFNNLPAGNYVVAVAASNFTGVLSGYWSSNTSRTATGAITEVYAQADPDDGPGLDSDDNGTTGLSIAVASAVVILGAPATTEPSGETDLDATLPGNQQGQPDTQANMTVDFGFYTMTIGNLVWNDLDNSGTLDVGEIGYGSVTVELRSGDGSTLLATTTTDTTIDPTPGFYSFTGLPAGDYIVRLPAINFNPGGVLRDFRSSTGQIPTLDYEPAPDTDTNTTDSDDNGTEVYPTPSQILGLGGYVQSQPVTLTPGAEEASTDATGTTTETRVDFGVNNSPQIDLKVTKTDNQNFYLAGGTLTYTIVVTNYGPADAGDPNTPTPGTGMAVNDPRPAQITSWTWTCASAVYGCTDSAPNITTDFTDELFLPQLASVTYTVVAQVSPMASDDLSNIVVVIPPVGMTDGTPLDNSAMDTDTNGDTAPPTVTSTSLLSNYAAVGPNTFTVTFSEDVVDPAGNTNTDDVTNPANYLLIEDGINGVFNTSSCAGGLVADDTQVNVTNVSYNTATYTATVNLSAALPVGRYRLFICGTTSIVDHALNALGGGVDFTLDFTVTAPASSLPATGFAPNRIASLQPQRADLAYSSMSDIWLEIPSLNLKTDILGIPKTGNNWNVDWLGNNAGWLNGTAFPSWEGNSVLTGHVYDANGLPGPFVNLKDLKYGDQIIIHLYGQKYIFEITKTTLVRPSVTSFAYQHLEGNSYLTLITCQSYDPKSNTYLYRHVVRAVLVDVQWDK